MGSLLDAIKLANLIKSIDRGRQTTVKTEDLVLNNCSEGEVIEELGELLPDVSVTILSQTFIVETISIVNKGKD